MPVNTGQIELFCAQNDGAVSITIQYDTTPPIGPLQPLVNRSGQCLQGTNTTGSILQAVVNGTPFTVPAHQNLGRSAQQMSQQGFDTRGDVTAASLTVE